jgi:hypothetical protein
MKRGKPMRRTPMKRSVFKRPNRTYLRSRRKGHGGAVAGRESATTSAWAKMVEEVKARHGHRCAVPWCRRSGPLDPQHVVKRSQGGADTLGNPAAGDPGNLLPLCRTCHECADNTPDGVTKVYLAPVSSEPPLACGFFVRQGDRAGFISLLSAGGISRGRPRSTTAGAQQRSEPRGVETKPGDSLLTAEPSDG